MPGARQRAVERRPVGARRARSRTSGDGERQRAASGSSSHGDSDARAATAAARSGTRRRPSPRTASARASRPSRTASVRLPARRSVSRSRTLLTTRIAARQQPDRHGEHERLPRRAARPARSRSRRRRRRRRTGTRTPRRGPRSRTGAGRRCRARRRGSRRRRSSSSSQPGDRRSGRRRTSTASAERHVGRDQHLPRRHEPAGGHAHRAEPVLGVGAAARVGVVVGEVRADLDEERAEQRGDERQPTRRSPSVAASAVPTSTGATAAGSVRGRAAISQMRDGARRRSRPPRELREVGRALLLVGLAPLLRLLAARRRGGSRRGRAAGCRRSRPRAALKLAFTSRSAKGESASISRHHCDRLLLEPVERHDGVDEPHLERLLRVVLAAQEPDLLGLLRARRGRAAATRRSRRRTSRPAARSGRSARCRRRS